MVVSIETNICCQNYQFAFSSEWMNEREKTEENKNNDINRPTTGTNIVYAIITNFQHQARVHDGRDMIPVANSKHVRIYITQNIYK